MKMWQILFIKDKFCYTLCHIRFHIGKCLGMFLYRILPCNIKYRLRCILALFQKLMDTATHIFPGQKRLIQNLIDNGMPYCNLQSRFVKPDRIFHAIDFKALSTSPILPLHKLCIFFRCLFTHKIINNSKLAFTSVSPGS